MEAINAFNASPGKGVTRLTFSKEYQGAIHYLVEELKGIGLKSLFTPGGNLLAKLKGSDPQAPVVLTGSHLDTVISGGRFDGTVGVVAALEAVRVIRELGMEHRFPIGFTVFAEEEGSRFGWGLLGSSILSGRIHQDRLGAIKDKDGMSFLEALERAGMDESFHSLLRPEDVAAMVEVHVEQGCILERANRKIGVVESMTGIREIMITVEGVSNHAGTTPMAYRFDAMQGASRIISAVEETALTSGSGAVATVGKVSCEPGQANVIPGRVSFTVDIRHSSGGSLEAATGDLLHRAETICRTRGLEFGVEEKAMVEPVKLSSRLCGIIERQARARKVEPLRMVSGAGHDTGIMASLCEAAMIFLPSKDGRSHCPEECTSHNDIVLGTEILVDTLLEIAL
ncbi:MAG: Zn-dependent hydrolase [Deltaproteobacteria bacterium]|nr:Zn-dependent hydrolase [Deltaproteobacteria bacterium]